jgi:hypothetical protein
MNVWNETPRLDGVRVLLVEGAPKVREVVADVLSRSQRPVNMFLMTSR